MPTSYTAEQVEAMAKEFMLVAQELGIKVPPEVLHDTSVSLLVDQSLAASSRWSQACTRPAGPFGAFLAGCAIGSRISTPFEQVDHILGIDHR